MSSCTRTPEAEAAPVRTLPDKAPITAAPAIPVQSVDLAVSDGFPVWMTSEGVRTTQTSGLSFVERTTNDTLLFFSCDDIGALHRLELRMQDRPAGQTTGDGWMRIVPITIPDDLKANFGTGSAKLDLEETVWVDNQPPNMTAAAMVSVEGNASDEELAADPRLHESRIEMVSVEFDAPFATATKLIAVGPFLQSMVQPAWDQGWEKPWEGYQTRDTLPLAGMEPNRSFEGVTMGGYRERPGMSAMYTEMWFAPEMPYDDSALIPESWQGTLPLFHSIQESETHAFRLRAQFLPPGCMLTSVCGLQMTKDGSALYVLDRNLQRIHKVFLADDGTFTAVDTAQLKLRDPHGIPYFTPSLESLTIDDQGSLWAVVDPWKYTPMPSKDQKVSARSRGFYTDEIPMLYRFDEWPE